VTFESMAMLASSGQGELGENITNNLMLPGSGAMIERNIRACCGQQGTHPRARLGRAFTTLAWSRHRRD
jgi:hypothetical protein